MQLMSMIIAVQLLQCSLSVVTLSQQYHQLLFINYSRCQ
jgi:hypothetical protein